MTAGFNAIQYVASDCAILLRHCSRLTTKHQHKTHYQLNRDYRLITEHRLATFIERRKFSITELGSFHLGRFLPVSDVASTV